VAALYKEQLGQIIRSRRKALDLTQRQLADRINVEEAQTVSRWERGENAPTDLEAVAKGLETTAGEMLAQLSPEAQRDRRRREDEAATQLDRIEASLAEVLAGLRRLEAAQLPAPSDELVRQPSEQSPMSDTARRGVNSRAGGSGSGSAR
jgi:transcriptional regulator with XRE-family HTH domain